MIFYYSYLYEKNRTGMYLVILIIVVKGHESPILWKKKGILVTKYVNETKEEHDLTRLGVPYAGNRFRIVSTMFRNLVSAMMRFNVLDEEISRSERKAWQKPSLPIVNQISNYNWK